MSEVKNPILHHINLKTLRLQEMINWYGVVVGAKVMHQFEGGAWMTNDNANHRIALITTPKLIEHPDRHSHTGMHHSAFEYDSLDDLLATYDRLDKVGIKPHMTLDHGLTTSFYYADPDGNSVELQSDNFGDWEKSSHFIATSEQFKANPIGAPVNPRAMLEARQAGQSVEEVQRRAYAGEFPPSEPMDPLMPIDL